MNIQRLSSKTDTPLEVAYRYFQVISILNELHLSKGELRLLAYTAHKGNISNPDYREEYCSEHKTTLATINNIVHRLKKKGLLTKDSSGVIMVNPTLTQVKFDKSLTLVLQFISPTLQEPQSPEDDHQHQRSSSTLSKEGNNSILNVQKYG